MQDKDIEQVLKSAGAREKPPAEIERAVRDGLRAEWRAMLDARRVRQRRFTALALAAGVVAAAIGVWLAAPQLSGPDDAIGTVTLASGELRTRSGFFGRWNVLKPGDSVSAGQTLATVRGGAGALAMPGGVSVRLDGSTRLTLASATEIALNRGALYVDAKTATGSPRLDVSTPAGSVRHVGTQYEVRLVGPDIRLRVREGRIEWQSRSGGLEQGQAGEQLTILGDGSVAREAALPYGDAWDWIAAATPVIDIEGLPLTEFLAWAARELGREVRFDGPGITREAAAIVLHGSIAGLTPEQALDAVLATTRLRATVAGGLIILDSQVDSATQID